jgi:hypothetical protein
VAGAVLVCAKAAVESAAAVATPINTVLFIWYVSFPISPFGD